MRTAVFVSGVVVGCLLLLVPALGASAVAVNDQPALTDAVDASDNRTIELQTDSGTPNGTAMVTLSATAENVAGYEVNISYDPSVVHFTGAAGQDLPDPVANANNDSGWVYLTSSAPEGTDDPTLAFLTFEVVGETGEESALQFIERDTLLNDADLSVYKAADGELTAETATVHVSEIGMDESDDSKDGNETFNPDENETEQPTTPSEPTTETENGTATDDGTTTENGTTTTTVDDGDSDDISGPSLLMIAVPAFGAGVLAVLILYLLARIRG